MEGIRSGGKGERERKKKRTVGDFKVEGVTVDVYLKNIVHTSGIETTFI